MNDQQRNQKRTASQDFLQSYEKQLLESFQEPNGEPEQPTAPQPPSTEPISLSELEEAIADIDHYLQTRQQQSSNDQD